jgi:LacI family transcriptional regulator
MFIQPARLVFKNLIDFNIFKMYKSNMPKIRKVILISEFMNTYDRRFVQGIGRRFVQGIGKYSRLHGPWEFFEMPVIRLNPAWKWRKREVALLHGWGADGIITRKIKDVKKLTEKGIPTINTDENTLTPDLPSVISNYAETGKIAAEYLLNRGFHRFAYCGFDRLYYWSRERAKSFRKRITEAGFETHIYKQPETKTQRMWSNEHVALADWLKSLPKPIGLMACFDSRGQELIGICKTIGLHVPEEVAIIGVDNDEVFCNLSNPPLSSVVLNREKAGYETAELLDRLMAGEKMAGQIITVRPTHIVTRQSTDTLAIEDREVAKAMRFIREHSRKSVQVCDVVNVVTISRRSLERRFRQYLGRSVHQEIKRVHIEQIALILVETNLSVSKIALALGYPDIDNIGRYFSREKGMTPLAYRKKYGGK